MLDRARTFVFQFALGGLLALKALWAPVALGASALIIDRSGRVLLARHSYMKGWSLPGGGVGRGEHPVTALMRELGEELGSVQADAPQLMGVYARRVGWASNVILLDILKNAEVTFRSNLEVREIVFADSAAPPPGTTAATRRRLAEFVSGTPPGLDW